MKKFARYILAAAVSISIFFEGGMPYGKSNPAAPAAEISAAGAAVEAATPGSEAARTAAEAATAESGAARTAAEAATAEPGAVKTTIEESELYARSAVLMDAGSGRILYEKDGKTARPIASTTKIMTCILALENTDPEDLVDVSGYAASMPKVRLGMQEGEHYYMKDLLYSMMLESHNDSAVAVAEHVAGSVERFADMMNQKAAEIGCQDTYFITPNGLDAQREAADGEGGTETLIHSATAEDLALIMSYCIEKSPEKEKFLEITRTPSYQFSNQEVDSQGNASDGSRSFFCNNHNAFLTMMDGALSGKTGFTGNAGYCYVGALEREGRTYVVALLACGWPNNKSYKWSDTRKLMEYGIANYQRANLSDQPVREEWLADIPVEDAKGEGLSEEVRVSVYAADEAGAPVLLMREGEQAELSCTVKTRLTAPVLEGEKVGTICYAVDGKVYWKRDILTSEGAERADFAWFFRMAARGYLFG